MAFDGIAETGAVVLTAYPARIELPRETTSFYLKADGIPDSPPGSQNPPPANPVISVPPVHAIVGPSASLCERLGEAIELVSSGRHISLPGQILRSADPPRRYGLEYSLSQRCSVPV
jgi:hypothetical protein